MQLSILLPSGIFFAGDAVERVVAETRVGSFGILEHRLDCVAALTPGILTYQQKDAAPVYVAVDGGVLVKTGAKVSVSVRRAVGGTDLAHLHDAVQQQFLKLNEQQRQVREALVKLEDTFVGKLGEFSNER